MDVDLLPPSKAAAYQTSPDRLSSLTISRQDLPSSLLSIPPDSRFKRSAESVRYLLVNTIQVECSHLKSVILMLLLALLRGAMSQTHMAHSIITKPLTRSTQDSVDSTAPEETQVGIPAFLNIFQSAAAYGDLLDEESDSEGEGSSDEVPTPPLTVGSTAKTSADDITTTTATTTKEKDAKEVNDLLTSTTSRLAQLAVNTYSTASAGLDGSGGKGPATHIQLPESACEITAKAKQENDRVIPLLIQEFGQMAEEGEEERLLAILDAAYFAQVAILGLVHCTTHRVTFHASLLQTRQNDHPAAQIIKSGPVTIHTEGKFTQNVSGPSCSHAWTEFTTEAEGPKRSSRNFSGLTRNLKHKKRVWFELSHDMLSTFPDSTDEGRTRPLRTLLCEFKTTIILAVQRTGHPVRSKRQGVGNTFMITLRGWYTTGARGNFVYHRVLQWRTGCSVLRDGPYCFYLLILKAL